MSRSFKKPYYSDKRLKKWFRSVRREWKQKLKKEYDNEDLILRKTNEIVNDYNYRDYYGCWDYYTTRKKGVSKFLDDNKEFSIFLKSTEKELTNKYTRK